MRLIFLLGFMFLGLAPASAAEVVNVPCEEMIRLGEPASLCDDFPTVKMTKAQYDQTKKAFAKKQCLQRWEAQFGHCKKYGHLWSDAPTPECEGNTAPKCDAGEDTAKKPKGNQVKLW